MSVIEHLEYVQMLSMCRIQRTSSFGDDKSLTQQGDM